MTKVAVKRRGMGPWAGVRAVPKSVSVSSPPGLDMVRRVRPAVRRLAFGVQRWVCAAVQDRLQVIKWLQRIRPPQLLSRAGDWEGMR